MARSNNDDDNGNTTNKDDTNSGSTSGGGGGGGGSNSPISQMCLGYWMHQPTAEQRGSCLGVLFVHALKQVHPSEYSTGTFTVVVQSVTKEEKAQYDQLRQQQEQEARDRQAEEQEAAKQTQRDLAEVRKRWREAAQQQQDRYSDHHQQQQQQQRISQDEDDKRNPNDTQQRQQQHDTTGQRSNAQAPWTTMGRNSGTENGNTQAGDDMVSTGISRGLRIADTVASFFDKDSQLRKDVVERVKRGAEQQAQSFGRAYDVLLSRRTVDKASDIVKKTPATARRAWDWLLSVVSS